MDNPLNWYRVEYDYEQRQTRSASLYYSRSIRWRPRSIASNDAESAAAVARDELDAFLLVTQWIEAGMPKIVVYATDEEAVLALEQAAQQNQIPACLIRDAGRTVVAPGTITCIGIGPASTRSIDSLTGSLPLL